MNYPQMKTSVDMIRSMGKFNVSQRTKDGYFDASHLLKQWNSDDNNPKREMKRFLDSPKTKKFIDEIYQQECHIAEMRYGDFQVVILIKGKTSKHGKKPDKVFMHQYLYIDFAMWLNSEFKYHVIKFVYDQLIEYRHAAGLGNNDLMDAVSRTWKINFPLLYKEINVALNYIVFNDCYTGIRNSKIATLDKLKDLHNLQKIFAYNILTGLIPDIKTLKLQLRKEFVRRYLPEHKTLLNEKK